MLPLTFVVLCRKATPRTGCAVRLLLYLNGFSRCLVLGVDNCESKRNAPTKNNKKSKRQTARRGSLGASSVADSDLEARIAALPENVTNRFGELCWAQGGSGYSWWPSMIFDPRRTEEPARGEGNRYLGVKYLVYFLECPETPFSCLYSRQIRPWFEGFCDDLHIGRAAKACGKQRHIQFQRALLVANHAVDLSPENRMDLDSLSLVRSLKPRSKRHKKRHLESTNIVTRKRRQNAQTDAPYETTKQDTKRIRVSKPQDGDDGASDDSKSMCKIVLKRIEKEDRNVGMVLLSSVRRATFSDVRSEIEKDLCGDLLPKNLDWRFYLPVARLPVSKRQETTLGSFYKILHKESDGNVGTGTFKDPIEMFIAEA